MELVESLSKLLANHIVSIEIIPGDGHEWLDSYPDNPYAPFLFVDGNLGLPEKILHKAYMAAVKHFGDPILYRRRLLELKDKDRAKGRRDALDITSVIILANPSHQSALNIRKTAVIDLSDPLSVTSTCIIELGFIAALLSAKECAKVSILWHYRWILLSRVYKHVFIDPEFAVETGVPTSEGDFRHAWQEDFPIGVLQNEFNLASLACEVYPRNYFAWYHRFLCFRAGVTTYAKLLIWLDNGSSGHLADNMTSKRPKAKSRLTDLGSALQSELENAKHWIQRHVSDYSAIDYVCKTHEEFHKAYRLKKETNIENTTKVSTPIGLELMRHALDLVQLYPSCEALWFYLRRTLFTLVRNHRNPRESIQLIREADSLARKSIEDAKEKCEIASKSGSTASETLKKEAHTISRHALRFLLWRRRDRPYYKPQDSADESQLLDRADLDRCDFIKLSCSHFLNACSKSYKWAAMDYGDDTDMPVLLLHAVSFVQ